MSYVAKMAKNVDYVNKVTQGDSLDLLQRLDTYSVDCCITSPPYWGLRDYGTSKWEGGDITCDHKMPRSTNRHRPGDKSSTNKGSDPITWQICGKCGAKRIDSQIGLEKTPEEYAAKLVEVFREVKRVLKPEGTFWLNLGDSYASGKGTCFNPGGGENSLGKDRKEAGVHPLDRGNKSTLALSGLKPKDLVGIPWLVAFALRADGWYLRQDIIWSKPNPMPESMTDRCTKSHEYIFLLTKNKEYYFDHQAIKEKAETKPHSSGRKDTNQYGADLGNRKRMLGIGSDREWAKDGSRNKRSVWTINTKPFRDAHFATFPEALIEPMVKAGCPKGGIIIDPFFGAGTTGVVALKNHRQFIGFELNPAYCEIARKRIKPFLDQTRLAT
jgi:DNA modification methylase